MYSSLLCALVLLGAPSNAGAPSLDRPLPDGTLLFLENVSSAVEWTTRGEIGHVALVFHDGGTAWVYEATPAKVRRITRDEYVVELARLNQRRDDDELTRVLVLRPKTEYTPEQVEQMRAYLDAQIGRRYSVKNYVRGKPYDGVHCAELASNTLNQSGRYVFENCYKIHPQALYAAVLPTHAEPDELAIPQPATKDPWRVRASRRCSSWFTWCGWSFREAWLFCW
jgi:hypothetical protein